MPNQIQVQLLPLGTTLTISQGASLQESLFLQGVEFPCGGHGRCKGCRIRVLKGNLALTAEDEQLLKKAEIDEGWRLACRARPEQNLQIELAQWEVAILSDHGRLTFTPKKGLGIAVDLGTTTLVAQLLDLETGNVLGVRSALNAQAQHGGDIMSRIGFAVAGGQRTLESIIREQLGELIQELLAGVAKRAAEVSEVVVVGNTVMHHLFSGLSVEPLSRYPFESENQGQQGFQAGDLGWADSDGKAGRIPLSATAQVRFLPCLGGFVGSDILAGVLATRLHESQAPAALVDLGTNGEIVIGNRDRMLCASTAAGPAFEGARISMGMRAATGAISEVRWRDGQLECRVLGNGKPRGICGSGLVDAVAAGLEAGWIDQTGRFSKEKEVRLAPPVVLSQRDIRELQLAKGAIAAGIRLLVRQWGASFDALARVYLAGAFGNYINRASARRIGLLNFRPERVEPAGNTALFGAKLALFAPANEDSAYAELRRKIQHVSLNEDAGFEDAFVEEMMFPPPG